MGLYFSQAIIWVKEHPVMTTGEPAEGRADYLGQGARPEPILGFQQLQEPAIPLR